MNDQPKPQETVSPFHRGEQAIQERLGVRDRMEEFARKAVRRAMPDQHRQFYEDLPFIITGTVDEAGNPWASILTGRPGFIKSPQADRLDIRHQPQAADPLAKTLMAGAAIGMVGMMLHNRRRNRVNGYVEAIEDGVIRFKVDQAFGNCPQYIQTRAIEEVVGHVPGPATELDRIDGDAANLIAEADTFFIASYADGLRGDSHNPDGRDVDASHRGGRTGFVKVNDAKTLTFPDYVGNFHFNTLGNIAENGRAGLLFADFETGDLVQLTGYAEILWEDDATRHFKGAERLVRFTLTHGIFRRAALPFRWSLEEFSPNSLMAGDWSQADASLKAETQRNTWRPYRVAAIEDETPTIRSFYLEPDDEGGLAPQEAGQFLPVRMKLADGRVVERTYTLSNAPADKHYRISVKRLEGGSVSTALHDTLNVGDIIEARGPRGHFTFDAAAKRPAVLLSAGVGITPLLSMLRHAVFEGHRTRTTRRSYFIHGGRDLSERAFYKEVMEMARMGQGQIGVHYALSRPGDDQEHGGDFQSEGRVTVDLLKQLLPFDDYDFYLCGPAGFMQEMYDGLRDMGIRDQRIFGEAFGPAGLSRRPDGGDAPVPQLPTGEPAEKGILKLQRSDAEALWTPQKGKLLEAAEATGVPVSYGCRQGSCGSCAAKLIKGDVVYPEQPGFIPAEGEVLLCSAVPRAIEGEAEPEIVIDL